MQSSEESVPDFFSKKAIKLALSVIAGAAIMNVSPAEALPSGSRSGGSSFRSAPSSRGSTRSYGSTTSYAPRTNTVIVAPMGGYGYGGGFSPFGFGYGGFGFMPMFLSPNVLVFALAAYIAVQLVSRVGGSDFGNNNDETSSSLGSGSSLIKLQVSLDDDWSKRGNIMDSLSAISSKGSSLSSRTELSRLLSDAALALLRKSGDWSAVAYKGEFYRGGRSSEVESEFQKLAIRERSKFEEEVSSGRSSDGLSSKPTQVVVSLIVAIRGKSQAYYDKNVFSRPLLRECLQNLAADALSDEGDNIMGVELLWTPSDAGLTISERDLIEDYPELIRL